MSYGDQMDPGCMNCETLRGATKQLRADLVAARESLSRSGEERQYWEDRALGMGARVDALEGALQMVVNCLGPDALCDCLAGSECEGLKCEADMALREAKKGLALLAPPAAPSGEVAPSDEQGLPFVAPLCGKCGMEHDDRDPCKSPSPAEALAEAFIEREESQKAWSAVVGRRPLTGRLMERPELKRAEDAVKELGRALAAYRATRPKPRRGEGRAT